MPLAWLNVSRSKVVGTYCVNSGTLQIEPIDKVGDLRGLYRVFGLELEGLCPSCPIHKVMSYSPAQKALRLLSKSQALPVRGSFEMRPVLQTFRSKPAQALSGFGSESFESSI